MESYFKLIEKEINKGYEIANKAKALGYDPENKVDMPLARNMAERVQGLIGAVAPQIVGSGVVERIPELEKDYGVQDWRVALKLAEEVALEKFCKFNDRKEAIEVGIRTGIAYVTVGVVASPLEGFVQLKLRKRRDNKEYFALFFSGPIRSAGGTGAAVSVLIADYVRKKFGYEEYDPSEEEINRSIVEIEDYHEKVANLQYFPSRDELRFMLSHLPVQIDGDPSEKYDVSNYKDLARIETNRIRNGICLVLAEALSQKAPKLWKQLGKWGKDFGLEHWNFLNEFVKLQKKIKTKGKIEQTEARIMQDYTYINDLVAGRPVLSYPLREGGFRLRYGRCRLSGFSSDAIHPATMFILNSYIAIGTQFKTERPGKASSISICDKIEGPIVKLKDGSVLKLNDVETAKKVANDVEEIIYLGDILINYGDFLNRAHKLIPCGYNEEWYARELEDIDDELAKKIVKDPCVKVNGIDALRISRSFNVPLHPRYTYYWSLINKEQYLSLLKWFDDGIYEDRYVLPFVYDLESDVADRDPKRVLELLGIEHVVKDDKVILNEDDSYVLKECLKNVEGENVLDIVNKAAGFLIRDKAGTFIGARMGRPEKAKMRKLKGSPQVLFPVGQEGGKMRNFQTALGTGKITSDFPDYYCSKCSHYTIYPVCEVCKNKTEFTEEGVKHKQIDINYYFKKALEKLKMKEYNEIVKGVKGVSNKDGVVENLAKGILRSKYNLYVNKDGTIRYDMTEMGMTHFKPSEIGTSIERLKELGYDKDIYGNNLVNEEQIIELKCQDVVLPACEESLEDGADKVLFRVANFIDELLVKFYGLKKFYNLKNEKELVGHLVVAMSPHTSAGATARIIGFTKTQGFFAHPLLHSLMRRDLDGDESCVILLMDCLLNFSRKYLPSHRGITQDAPLVLTSRLIPNEVDDMVFDMDVAWKYPKGLYEAALEYKNPWEIKIETFGDFLGTERQYQGLGFTHDVSNVNMGVLCSAYKSIPLMMDKVLGQMEIAEKIRAVDEADVARLVIEKHFLRDIKGNLRKFSMQEFRCVDCNEKYRRPPLIGNCIKCGGKIIFTIAEGGIVKYLEPSLQLAEKYDLPAYLRQTLMLTKARIESVFGKDDEKQEGLRKWF